MRRNIFRALSLLVVLCLTLSACGGKTPRKEEARQDTQGTEAPPSDEELIAGQWRAFVACDSYFHDMLEESMGKEVVAYFDFTGIGFHVLLSFDGAGSYTLALDENSLVAFAQEVLDIIMASLHAYMEDTMSGVLDGKTLDEHLASIGTDFDQMMSASRSDAQTAVKELINDFAGVQTKSTYTVEDGRLILDGAPHGYTVDTSRLTIEAPDGGEDVQTHILFPLAFEKIG